MSEQDVTTRLLTAIRFAAEKHRQQRRKDVAASPYINHPIEVAEVLADIGGVSDLVLLQAAILHDTIEDTQTSGEELEGRFGESVRRLVEEVTDDKRLPKRDRKRLQIEHTPSLSSEAKQLKLADKICNVRDLGQSIPKGWSRQRCLEYLDWAEQVVAGCRGSSPRLEAYFEQTVAESRRLLQRAAEPEPISPQPELGATRIVTASRKERLIVGVTGATGIVYAARALQVLRSLGIETHLVVSRAAELTRAYETDLSKEDLAALADHVYGIMDVGAPISSGSFQTMGMLIAPASMRSVAEIATGVTSSLLTRAADVVLKERRRLVLMVRETPLNLIHLRNMVTITEAGGIIFPPVPAFYPRPTTLEEVVDQSVGRVLDQFGLHTDIYPRWSEDLRNQVASQNKNH